VTLLSINYDKLIIASLYIYSNGYMKMHIHQSKLHMTNTLMRAQGFIIFNSVKGPDGS
jgi:uncharacterized membrane protein